MSPMMYFCFEYEDLGRSFEHSFLRPSNTDWNEILREAHAAGYRGLKPLHRQWPKYAWPGGYPLYYITEDGSILSPDAANQELSRTLDPDDDVFCIVDQDINWEDPDLICDHTGQRIESAYEVDDV